MSYQQKSTLNPQNKQSNNSQDSSERYNSVNLNLQQRAFFWDVMIRMIIFDKILLKTYSPQSTHLPTPSPLQKTLLDMPQQRTLHLDIPRTRPQQIPPGSHRILEQVITYFCKAEDFSYKQGVNEIFGVVAVFNNVGLPWEKVWEYGRAIILNHTNNFFQDDEFLSLQCAFSYLNLLIKFHDYEIWDRLNNINMLPPELYATPWGKSKMNLETVFTFWEAYFIENDRFFFFYFIVATLQHFKTKLFSIDPSFLPQSLTGITIDKVEDLKCIYLKALIIRANTPNSFSSEVSESKIFEIYTRPSGILNKTHMRRVQEKLDQKIILEIHPFECLFLLFPNQISCPNATCSQNASLYNNKNIQKSCCFCAIKNKTIPNEMRQFVAQNQDLHELMTFKNIVYRSYQIVDIRNSNQGGHFKQSITIDKMSQNNNKTFILMDECGQSYVQVLQEFNNLSFVCVVQGGFKAIHDLALQLKFKLLEGHHSSSCQYCQKDKNEGFWDTLIKVFKWEDSDTDKSANRIQNNRTPRQFEEKINKENHEKKILEATQNITTQTSLSSANSPKNPPRKESQPSSTTQSVMQDDGRFNQNHFFSKERKSTPFQVQQSQKNKTDQNIQKKMDLDIIVPIKKTERPIQIEKVLTDFQMNQENFDDLKTLTNKILVPSQPRKIVQDLQKYDKKKDSDNSILVYTEDQLAYGQQPVSLNVSNRQQQQSFQFHRTHFLQVSPQRQDLKKKSSSEFTTVRYCNTGLFYTYGICSDQLISFLNNFKDNQFRVYSCSATKDSGKIQKRILLMTQGKLSKKEIFQIEFTIIMKMSEFLLNVLTQLQNNKIWHYVGQRAKQQLIINFLQQESQKLGQGASQQEFRLKQFYLMIFLKKISSKKQNICTLSFYYKQPALVRKMFLKLKQYNEQSQNQNSYFHMLKSFQLSTLEEMMNHQKLYKLYSDTKNLPKMEIKAVVTLDRTQDVQNCIEVGKSFYKEILQIIQSRQDICQNLFAK